MIGLPRTLAASVLFAFAACAPEQTTAPTADRTTGDPATSDLASAAEPGAELALASNSWSTRAPMTDAWFGFGAAVINNSLDQPVVYGLGGALDNDLSENIRVFIYNVATNTWRDKNIIGDPTILRSRGNGVARIGNVLYLTGGFDLFDGFGYENGLSLTQGTVAYKTSTNSLIHVAGFAPHSADGVTGVINGKMYVLIGTGVRSFSSCDEESCPLSTLRQLYRYDPSTDTWATRKPAPHYHRMGVGGVINGKFYVVGGFDSQNHATRNVDVYNPTTDSWATVALIPETLTKLKAAVLQNKLFVVSPTATYAYTAGTNTWARKPTGPANSAARADGGVAVTVTLGGRQRMVVVGGKAINGRIPLTAVYTP